MQAEVPHIAVGTPGRILDLATKRKVLDLSKVRTHSTASPFYMAFVTAFSTHSMARRAHTRIHCPLFLCYVIDVRYDHPV